MDQYTNSQADSAPTPMEMVKQALEALEADRQCGKPSGYVKKARTLLKRALEAQTTQHAAA